MKRVIMTLIVLSLCMVSVESLAELYAETGCNVSKEFACPSPMCQGAEQSYRCGSHQVTEEFVDCPDNIVNCICVKKLIRHTYSCCACAHIRYIYTTVYNHSK
jgi:hypothetical protein